MSTRHEWLWDTGGREIPASERAIIAKVDGVEYALTSTVQTAARYRSGYRLVTARSPARARRRKHITDRVRAERPFALRIDYAFAVLP